MSQKEQTFRDIEEKILNASNYGLDIIQDLYPTASTRKNFRIRHDDKTASARVSKEPKTSESGLLCYRVTDYGGSVQNENCFGLFGIVNNISYPEAVLELANIYQAKGHQILETKKVVYKPEYREYKVEEFPGELNEKGFAYKEKEFTNFELGLLGPEIRDINNEKGKSTRIPLVTAEICKEVNLVSLEEYSFLNAEKTKVITYRATEKFPILAFVNEDEEIGLWLKIYKPRAGKKYTEDGKDYRFHHLGGRPADFIFGLERLEDLLQNYKDDYLKKNKDAKDEEIENLKLPRIVIATGGSDGLNLLALGEPVVWFNSETQKITKYILNDLKKYAEVIINVPDCDATGKNEGRNLALEFMDVRTLWLDTYFKNKNSKDFKDYAKENQALTRSRLQRNVNQMMEATMPAKFWTSEYNEKSKRTTHNFSPTFAFYFLRLNGFCRVLDESRKDGYYFARISGNVVEEVDTTKIKNFFRDFLIEKQKREGVREISYGLMDALITTTRISESTMDRLHSRTLDFTDFDMDAQYFFIGNKVFKTTAKGTETSKFDRYVLKSQLIDELIYDGTGRRINTNNFKIETVTEGETEKRKKYFEIKEVGDSIYDIEILDKDCVFLNYLIQTSRVHWQDEMKAMAKKSIRTEEFYEKSKFNISSEFLDDFQNETQKMHLINKIYTLGYCMHRFKDESKPFTPFGVDEAVLEDDAAEGGAGKTIFYKSLRFMCKMHTLSGKADFENDKFLFEGITEHTDLVYMDDVKRTFDLTIFYDVITGDLIVNTKNEKKFTIPYSLSPKFMFSSNYSLRDQSGSSKRRRLVNGFSDYYHAENIDRAERTPKDDFGHILFTDWKDVHWYKYINFMMQCLEFYLGCKEKINPPSSNILMRTYFSIMGVHFKEWADNTLPNIINEKQVKISLHHQAKNHNKKFLGDSLSASAFTKKMHAWCNANGYTYETGLNENIYWKEDNEIEGRIRTKEHVRIVRKGETAPATEPQEDELPY